MVMPIITPNGPFGGVTIFAHEALSVGASSTILTVATMLNATVAVIICEVAPVRYWVDGTAPSATVGKLLNVGDQLVITGHDNLVNFHAFAQAASGTLNVEYGR